MITLYKPRTKAEKHFLVLITKAMDCGITLECIDNVTTAILDDDTVARLAEYRDAETDPALRQSYQTAIDLHLGGNQ